MGTKEQCQLVGHNWANLPAEEKNLWIAEATLMSNGTVKRPRMENGALGSRTENPENVPGAPAESSWIKKLVDANSKLGGVDQDTRESDILRDDSVPPAAPTIMPQFPILPHRVPNDG